MSKKCDHAGAYYDFAESELRCPRCGWSSLTVELNAKKHPKAKAQKEGQK